MTKEEFLISLKECLEGQVSNDELVDTMAYYRSYFQEEENNGKTEAEIVKFLGSPRLIAHTIIDAQEGASDARGYDRGAQTYTYEEGSEEEGSDMMEQKPGFLTPGLKVGLIIFAIVAVAGVIFTTFWPFFLVIFLVILISNFFKRR